MRHGENGRQGYGGTGSERGSRSSGSALTEAGAAEGLTALGSPNINSKQEFNCGKKEHDEQKRNCKAPCTQNPAYGSRPPGQLRRASRLGCEVAGRQQVA